MKPIRMCLPSVWLSKVTSMGLPLPYTCPDIPCSRQNGRLYSAANLAMEPIRYPRCNARRAAGSAGRKSIWPQIAGDIATITLCPVNVPAAECTTA